MRKVFVLTVLGVAVMGVGIAGRCPSANGEQASTSTQTASTTSIEGTTWPVKLVPDAMAAQKGEKPFDDDLSFKDGKVTMSACVKVGFEPSNYTLSPVGEAWSFKTRQVSKEQGETLWTGKIVGEAIKGTMIWTKKDGTVLRYSYEGKKAATSGQS